MIKILLIADLHLDFGESDKTNLFIKFCKEYATKVDQLFILGDLFDAWLGDDISIEPYQKVISTLKTLGEVTQVFITKGNRDFLLGKEFIRKTGCILLDTPYLLVNKNQKYVLTHGDELCTDDKDYQRLRRVLRHPVTQFILLHLPIKIRFKIINQLRKKSIQAQQHKTYEIMDVNQKAVEKLMQKYPNTNLIHGHTHRLNTHKNTRFTRYVLGDWSANKGNSIKIDTQLSWLEIR